MGEGSARGECGGRQGSVGWAPSPLLTRRSQLASDLVIPGRGRGRAAVQLGVRSRFGDASLAHMTPFGAHCPFFHTAHRNALFFGMTKVLNE